MRRKKGREAREGGIKERKEKVKEGEREGEREGVRKGGRDETSRYTMAFCM